MWFYVFLKLTGWKKLFFKPKKQKLVTKSSPYSEERNYMKASLMSQANREPRPTTYLSPPICVSSKTWQRPRTSDDSAFTLVWMEPPQAWGTQDRIIRQWQITGGGTQASCYLVLKPIAMLDCHSAPGTLDEPLSPLTSRLPLEEEKIKQNEDTWRANKPS